MMVHQRIVRGAVLLGGSSASHHFRIYALDAIYDDGRSANRRPIKTIADSRGSDV